MGAIEKIRAQQAQLKEGSDTWIVGNQLAKICAAEPESERLVDVDLDNAGMALTECAKKIRAWAAGHRQDDFAFVSPQKAEEIIREFYGLPGYKGTGGKVNFLDYL